MKAPTLQAFLDEASAFTGFKNPAAYYANCNPTNVVHAITTPLLIVNALDDPCCRAANALQRSRIPAHAG